MIRSGVSFPSYVADATFALAVGAAQAGFPVASLGDLKHISRSFKSSGPLGIAITCVLAQDESVEFVAIVNHNAIGATYRIRCYSDAAMTSLVDDSGDIAFLIPAVPKYRQVTPYVLPQAMTVRAVRVDLGSLDGPWVIGGLEVAGFWAFEELAGREIGVAAGDAVTVLGDGAKAGTARFSPRTAQIKRDLLTIAEKHTALDFLQAKQRSEPFVWVRAYEDNATWEREAVLMHNKRLPAIAEDVGTLSHATLTLEEHLR